MNFAAKTEKITVTSKLFCKFFKNAELRAFIHHTSQNSRLTNPESYGTSHFIDWHIPFHRLARVMVF